MAETINLSKVKREKLLSKLELLKQQIDDEDMIATLNEVETIKEIARTSSGDENEISIE